MPREHKQEVFSEGFLKVDQDGLSFFMRKYNAHSIQLGDTDRINPFLSATLPEESGKHVPQVSLKLLLVFPPLFT
jgi:hypothetical protein